MDIISDKWKEYEIISTKNGEKLEKWGNYILRRPDPGVFWEDEVKHEIFENYDAIYHRSKKGGGNWEYKTKLPESWKINYKDMTFQVKPTGFKHTGIFPEQAVNWDYARTKIQSYIKENNLENNNNNLKALNLFAYTGCATVNLSKSGINEVVHVDSSKGMTAIAKENANLSNVSNNYIRYIVDDVFKFIDKEIRRNRKYHAIIMDPPSYGRGKNGEIWKLEESLIDLINKVNEILVDKPIFLIINSYTTGLSPTSLKNIILTSKIKNKFNNFESGETLLKTNEKNIYLPCGIYLRMEN